jgi:type IV secretion system protein TrbE
MISFLCIWSGAISPTMGSKMAVYEEYQPHPRWRAEELSDVVPWRSVLAPGVILQKQRYGLQRSYVLRGPDVTGETPETQGALMLQANDVLKRLGGRWMLQSEAQRGLVTHLPPVAWRHPVAALLDQAHRQRLLGRPGSRETTYYGTLTWYPPTPAMRRGLTWLMHGPAPAKAPTDATVSVREFIDQADYLLALLKGMLAVCRALSTAQTLTYLHSCVSDRWHPVGPLAFYHDIDQQLCDTPWWGGWYPFLGHDPQRPELGGRHVRTCSVTGYPATSMVGVMQELDAADVDYRWCTRWLGLERHVQAGILRKTQGTWVGEERSFWDRVTENVTHQPTRILNTDATNKAEDVDAARQEVGANIVAYGTFTSTITVADPDVDRVEEHLKLVMQALESHGFVATAERMHATPAWLSTHPGNQLDNVRRSTQHTLTLAHLCPGLTAAWPGPDRDAYLHGGPWFYAHIQHNTLFRVVNHVRDLGHFLVLGATRSGKSTSLNLSQFVEGRRW